MASEWVSVLRRVLNFRDSIIGDNNKFQEIGKYEIQEDFDIGNLIEKKLSKNAI